jgi:hypothetical protein
MPDNLKSGIENLSRMDMSDVRVHRTSPQPARFGAQAYSQGSQVHLPTGQDRQLAHETWHTTQQKQGRVQATREINGAVNVHDDKKLEREADVLGSQALGNQGRK